MIKTAEYRTGRDSITMLREEVFGVDVIVEVQETNGQARTLHYIEPTRLLHLSPRRRAPLSGTYPTLDELVDVMEANLHLLKN